MESYEAIKEQADTQRKSKNYSVALPFYKKLWENHRDDCTKWDGWGYAQCLSKIKDYAEALKICREVYPMDKDFAHLKNLYAWSIFYTEIKVDTISNEAVFFKAGKGIINLTNQEDKYSPYIATIYKIVEYLTKKSSYNPVPIIEWTNKLNPDYLDSKPFSFVDAEGRNRTVASKKESYFSWRIKALFKLEKYAACKEICKLALESFTNFHYNNDVWFKQKMALSDAKLGNISNAIEQLTEILTLKKDWFIYRDIADLLLQTDRPKEALAYSISGAFAYGNDDKKIKLYSLMADILLVLNKKEEAKKHLSFMWVIRNDENWNITNEFQQKLSNHQVDTENLPNGHVLKRELTQIWNDLKYANQTKLEGKILKILPNGRAGFVQLLNIESYYFQTNEFKGKRHLLKRGTRVEFYLEDSFDAVKKQASKKAVFLVPKKF